MTMTSADWWVLATAVACAVPCAVLGCFLVLRRMSLLGDAITHAMLPGLVVAFALTGTRSPGAMLIGAAAMGMLTALLSAGLSRWGKVEEGASLGVVFTALFAIGVILINIYARNVDLDPGCVLYGVIEYVPLDTLSIAGLEFPRAFLTLAVIGGAVCILTAVFFKELKIASFDPALATTLGLSAAAVHYGLLGAVAATSVASFEAVGSVLVVAMLVAPAATAQLLTDRLGPMVWTAVAIAAADAALGWWLAVLFDSSVAGMMAAVSGGMFIAAVIAAPRYGLIGRALRRAALAVRIAEEDILGALYRAGERGHPGLAARPSPGWAHRTALARLIRRGDVERCAEIGEGSGGAAAPSRLNLSPRGHDLARSIVRAHRLWESYLARHTDLPLDHLHDPSERVEHHLSPEMQERLAAEQGGAPEADPHGRPIPPRAPDA